jgi:hypothetical protein
VPAEQPPPKPAEANKVLANDELVKWSSKPTDPKNRDQKILLIAHRLIVFRQYQDPGLEFFP